MVADTRYIASARTEQKTPLPTALLLLRACVLGYHVTATGALRINRRVCRAVPYQRLSLLASQFWLSADMPQYTRSINESSSLQGPNLDFPW
jgi:hypothetical protein